MSLQLPQPGFGAPDGGEEEEKPLPSFRRDLEIYPAPDEPDGSPAFSIYDPVTSQFYKISWAEALIIKKLRTGMKMSDLLDALASKTTIQATAEDVGMFFEQAKRMNLLSVDKPASQVETEFEAKKVHPIKWLIFHYLYFRIPLFNPDKFLADTLPIARLFVSKTAMAIYLFISLLGLSFLIGRLDTFFYTIPYFFSVQGAIAYSAAIIFTKVIHELAHGYTAKHYDVRVPKMGIAFIFFWPVMYTDVTDSWKLSDRKERLAITAAGVIVELLLAGVCTLGWALTEPGILQSVFFVVSSVSWISTLLINVNPAMRFDGYYLFSDILGVDNLQMRGFAYTRWRLRKWFLGIDIPPPEIFTSAKRKFGLMFYSIYTWIYRLFLYTAIAIMVYTEFTKALGIFLFFLEIGIFFIWPLVDELKRLVEMRQHVQLNRRFAITMTFIIVLFGYFFLPMAHRLEFPAVTVPIESQTLYSPRGGVLDTLYVEKGEQVVVDQPLLKIYSKALDLQIKELHNEIQLFQTEINILSATEDENQAQIPEKMAELASTEEKLVGFQEQQKQNTLHSNLFGTVYDLDETIAIGQSVAQDQVLGRVADLTRLNVVCYVPEVHINDVYEGKDVIFKYYGTENEVHGTIEYISPVRATQLPHPQLASVYHGEIPVVSGPEDSILMVESYYSVTVSLHDVRDVEVNFGETGEILTRGPWRSKGWDFTKRIWALFWEESSF
ncbi:Uncharacterized protein SCG7109_AF_00150 [Chlamydiales bacterium SCGC AG-110-M15]|nr:Uncharacterized protein SCG7109_AF_00150 [Chlamydiales bacterium SCGC AG-110-M15]